ncbi:unnamed protein product [Heligmosomoides polygyrus]|uniref:PPM-type phosphatase domain-containing protein n=1 Tax=Heligmosomoides polygyrus TaxID=6339 RepID=A0A183F238_HELPZ|nr:unnamed protein product [Heligmosomoides polygyrus]
MRAVRESKTLLTTELARFDPERAQQELQRTKLLKASDGSEAAEPPRVFQKSLFNWGSQISILPLKFLLEAQKSGFDLDSDVKEIKYNSKKSVYDASGNDMEFIGAVVATVTWHGAPPERVAMFVRKPEDDIVILGTCAS